MGRNAPRLEPRVWLHLTRESPMNEKTSWGLIALTALTLAFTLTFLRSGKVWAHDHSDPHAAWYKSQQMNPEAQQRLGVPYKSCCDAGDVFPTRFRVGEKHQD